MGGIYVALPVLGSVRLVTRCEVSRDARNAEVGSPGRLGVQVAGHRRVAVPKEVKHAAQADGMPPHADRDTGFISQRFDYQRPGRCEGQRGLVCDVVPALG